MSGLTTAYDIPLSTIINDKNCVKKSHKCDIIQRVCFIYTKTLYDKSSKMFKTFSSKLCSWVLLLKSVRSYFIHMITP